MIKQAIQKAIKGGYRDKVLSQGDDTYLYDKNEVLLDPLFWQSLGKSLEWNNGYCIKCKKLITNIMNNCYCGEFDPRNFRHRWRYEWHSFIDHLADNGNPEDFFKELLK